MALILAIEPDRRQASKVAAIINNRLHEELVHGDTTEHAIEKLGARIPDLILTSLLLSRKDDAALADWLRDSDAAGAHVQTLVIPVLGGSARDLKEEGGGLLSRLTRGRSKDDASTDGCDPEIFAAQIREYLERAAEERDAAALRLEDMEEAANAAPAAETGEPRYEPAYGDDSFVTPQPAREERPADNSSSWAPYAADSDVREPVDFEVEAVTPEPMDAAPIGGDQSADAQSADEDADMWSEISLGGDSESAAPPTRHAYAQAEEDDDASVELTSESIDLQRFVEELSSEAAVPESRSATRRNSSKDDVLAEFEEALEVFADGGPNRRNGSADADSEVLTPLAGATAWPHLDSTVAQPAPDAAASAPDAVSKPAPARRTRKKSRAVGPQAEWSPFDPERCGFAALLAKLEKMSDDGTPEKSGR
jgi:hypothetical protein